MIPHHQNAVNMAKIILKSSHDVIDSKDAQLGDDAFLNELFQHIINTQNMQIMKMHEYLVDEEKQNPWNVVAAVVDEE